MIIIGNEMMKKGHQSGWIGGAKFGKKEKERETVQKMHANGASIDMISKLLNMEKKKIRIYIDTITKH